MQVRSVTARMQKVPVGRKIALGENEWFTRYKALAENKPYHILLESGRGGRYCIIGLDPVASLKGKDTTLEITDKDGNKQIVNGHPLKRLKEFVSDRTTKRLEGFPDFTGGAIGYLTYDCVRFIEDLPSISEDDLAIPDLYFLLFDDVFVYDKEEKALYMVVHVKEGEEASAEEMLDRYQKQWSKQAVSVTYPFESVSHSLNREVSFTEESFMEAVEKFLCDGPLSQAVERKG